MKTDKFFNILVLGGTLITAPNIYAEITDQSATSAVLEQLLNAEPIASVPVLCSPDDKKTCVVGEGGVRVPRAGVYCCWGSSCEN